jgi:magnesium transporter
MISATFSSTILNFFESALPAVLVLFVPMLMDTGGNSGGQASVTLIRGLSLGEVTSRDIFRILYKGLRVGFLCGLVVGCVAFGKVMLVDSLIMGNPAVTVFVALAVALTMLVTVLMAKIIGCLLPLAANRMGLDPAVMASPFVTTIVDAFALLLYFVIASSIL